jgi:hypothetical protein
MLRSIVDIPMAIMTIGGAAFVIVYGAIGAYVLCNTAKEFIDSKNSSDDCY